MNQIITQSSLSKVKIPGEIIAPQKKVKTLQNSQSEALLFSIGTDNQLYCVKEKTGSTEHQWSMVKLSTNLGGGKVIDFALSYEGSKLDLIVAVEVAGKHKVYTSIGNNLDGNFQQVTWEYIKYDDTLSNGSLRFSILIVKQLDIQTVDGVQYISIFVDDTHRTFKYYIDLDPESGGKKWNPRQFAVDYNNALIDSCIGKPKGAAAPGLYTLGVVGGNQDAILFTPLYNPYDRTLNPSPRPLHVAKNGMNALASVEVINNYTDLFVAGQGILYHFPYDKQKRDNNGTSVFTHELFHDVEDLYAVYEDNQYIIWGRNKQKEIFYTVCSKNQINTQNAWSNPVVLNKDIVQFSFFFNTQTKEINYFALKDSNELIYAVRSEQTTVWKEMNVIVPSTNNSQFESTAHVTKILVTGANGVPQNNAQVTLQAVAPCRVYLNNIFTLLDSHPKTINTNSDGLITIAEPSNDLQGTCLKVQVTGVQKTLINPMNSSMEKLSSLQTTSDLSKIGVNNTTPQEVKTELLKTIQKMSDLYIKMPANGVSSSFTSTAALQLPANQVFGASFSVASGALKSEPLTGIGEFFTNGINLAASFVGDVASSIENLGSKVVKIAIGFAKGAWRIVSKIAGKVYHFIIDTATSIVSSIGGFISSLVKTAEKWINAFLDMSKGVDAYIFSESSFNPTIKIAGQTFSSTSNGFGFGEKEISVRDILKNEITLNTGGITKTAKVDPFTGLLFSQDLGQMLNTPSVITNDYAVSYGLYDAGMGFKGLTNKDQVYLYASKNHSNWLGDLITKYPSKDILISDLVLAGSHDSGMHIDIPTEVAVKARLLLVAAGFILGTVPIVQLLTPVIFAAAAIYDPKKISRNLAVTQKENVTNQLKLGVRFFDFRPGYNILDLATNNSLLDIILNLVKNVTATTSKTDLNTIKGNIQTALSRYLYTSLPICHIHAVIPGIELKQMISETVAFLEEHPKEVVVIEIKYSGIVLDKMKPTYEVIDNMINSHLGNKIKKVNIVKTNKGITSDYTSWKTFNTTKVKNLINENKRLVIAYEQNANDSYNDYAYGSANPEYIINGYTNSHNAHEDGLVDTVNKSTVESLSVLQLQGTITNTVFNMRDPETGNLADNIAQLALALAAQTNAGSFLLSTKGKMDCKTYPWLREELVNRGKGKGAMILLNDFVDSMLGAIAVEATDKRLQNK